MKVFHFWLFAFGLLFTFVTRSSNLSVTNLDTRSQSSNEGHETGFNETELDRKVTDTKPKDSSPVNFRVFEERRAGDDASTTTKEAFLRFANQLVESQLDGWQDLNPFVKHLLDTIVDPVTIGNSTMSLVDLIGSLVIDWIDFGYRH